MILDPKRLSGFIREGQELREHLEENPSQTEQHNAWVERINGYFLEQGAEDYAVRLNDFSGMTFYGDGSDRSQISNSITGRCQRLQEFIAEIRSQSMTQPNQRDHGEPPGFVKNLMWLFRKRTWKEHPMPAAVALVIMISGALVAISQIINKELPDESPETELLKEYLKACESGDAEACNSAGVRIGDGEGAPVDFGRSAQLYQTSCQLGSARGCRNAARRVRDGRGVDRDYDKALDLFEQSCAPHYPRGCRELSDFRAFLDTLSE